MSITLLLLSWELDKCLVSLGDCCALIWCFESSYFLFLFVAIFFISCDLFMIQWNWHSLRANGHGLCSAATRHAQIYCLQEIFLNPSDSITFSNTEVDLYNVILYNAMICITQKFLKINNEFYNYKNIDIF